jgi:hypothetical protein
VIHVALVSTYPTETTARMGIAEDLHVVALGQFRGCPYLGIWTMPQPYVGRVHVFSDEAAERLDAAGWTKEDA